MQANEDSGNRRPIMLETVNSSDSSSGSRRGETGSSLVGEKRSGEATVSQLTSQDKGGKKVKKDKSDGDTSGTVTAR